MSNKKQHRKHRLVSGFVIGTFVTLYLMVSIISTIHVIAFFQLSNPDWLAISLAVAFEVGAAASLASLVVLKKMNKSLVWSLFIILTLMQAMGNTYYAFIHLEGYSGWIELFDLIEEEPIFQKRVLSLISGAILPLVALGFIKSLVDYIKPEEELAFDDMEEDEEENRTTPRRAIVNDDDDDVVTISSKKEEPKHIDGEKEEKSVDVLVDQDSDVVIESKVELVESADKSNIDEEKTGEEPEKQMGMLSPEHYGQISPVNSNQQPEEKFKKRYPENLGKTQPKNNQNT